MEAASSPTTSKASWRRMKSKASWSEAPASPPIRSRPSLTSSAMRFALLFAVVLYGFAEDRPIQSPEPLRPLVDLARTAPPELAAETLIRLVESNRIPSKEAQVDLLVEAFQIAGRSQRAVPMRDAGSAVPKLPSGYEA